MKNLRDERDLLSKPGDTILETIEHLKMSQSELADRLGKTPSKVNDLISGKEPITVKTAMQLETVLGIDTQFWLNRESLYREKLTRIEQEEFLEQCNGWLNEQPVKELKKCGYLNGDKKGAAMVDEMLQFYGVVTPAEWSKIYVDEFANADFKRSTRYRTSLGSMAAFLRIGELEMLKLKLPPFDKSAFREKLSEVKILARKHPEDYAQQLKDICFSCGVGLVYSFSFPGAPISGLVRWVAGNPMIQLTDRYKFNDRFWFAFFHEVGHVILHGKKDVFIEQFEGVIIDKKKEDEADAFANEWLVPDEYIEGISKKISEKEIKILAREIGVHPGILVGRLQDDKIIDYSYFNNLKLRVTLEEDIKIQREM
jgi:HTH-type transcriptional regulator / antitoxin HigA